MQDQSMQRCFKLYYHALNLSAVMKAQNSPSQFQCVSKNLSVTVRYISI